ncbi:hypothetical protein N658DRAFT_51246 [Parathielavia hyrcaniae]|uniref:Uncharacterized protein n=1 Tax=Parathielavia hyrcaniae TaxID=113614 RepID=A0AAN6Q1E0_9PEZI|nr:hypothetical protein N658DRAFT_51246 [Parathielavia hyrcaniae]
MQVSADRASLPVLFCLCCSASRIALHDRAGERRDGGWVWRGGGCCTAQGPPSCTTLLQPIVCCRPRLVAVRAGNAERWSACAGVRQVPRTQGCGKRKRAGHLAGYLHPGTSIRTVTQNRWAHWVPQLSCRWVASRLWGGEQIPGTLQLALRGENQGMPDIQSLSRQKVGSPGAAI